MISSIFSLQLNVKGQSYMLVEVIHVVRFNFCYNTLVLKC